ncbi:MAG: hypothetical protein AAFN74_02720 [Myxococcota bacterium]
MKAVLHKTPIRRVRSHQRGFALFAVIVLMAVMAAAVAMALDDAVVSVRNSGGIRAAEMIKSGLDRGVNVATLVLQEMDPFELLEDPEQFDLFAGDTGFTNASEFRPDPTSPPLVFPYPDAGPYQGEYQVRIGIRPTQRTRAPSGEDINNSFGQIFEIQVGVAAVGTGIPPAEQRAAVGIMIPRTVSHAN